MIQSFFLWQRESWRAFWRQRSVMTPLFSIAVILIITWVTVITAPISSDNSFALRYSIYVGINWLTEPFYFYLLPIVATIFVVINVFLSYTLARRSLVLKYLWLWATVFIVGGFLWLAWLLRSFNT
jgi:hypothetical protein